MSKFIYANIDTEDYGLIVADEVVDYSPKRVYEEVEIPGKDGVMLLDMKRYENCEHSYTVVIPTGYEDEFVTFRNKLMSKVGYNRLTDSFNAGEFYMACIDEDFAPVHAGDRDMGKARITFTRKPQRFLTSGETERTLTVGNVANTVTNPTDFPSKPLLKVKGSGSVYINSDTITITGVSSSTTLYIDCDLMDAYTMSGSAIVPANDKIQLSNDKFPKLKAGSNTIRATTTSASIIPRWWRL